MNCGKRWCYLLLVLLCLLVASALAHGQPTGPASSPPSSPPNGISESSPTSEQPTMLPGDELMMAWQKYKEQFSAFGISFDQFLMKVEAFGIAFEDLPTYISFLTDSLEQLRLSQMKEREESDRKASEILAQLAVVEKKRKFWIVVAVAGSLGGSAAAYLAGKFSR